jgi:hypothetical protein
MDFVPSTLAITFEHIYICTLLKINTFYIQHQDSVVNLCHVHLQTSSDLELHKCECTAQTL